MVGFTPSGRVIVLGAGASVFAGYPLAAELLGFVRNYTFSEAKTREKASRVLWKLSEAETIFTRDVVRNPNGVANLEELLTYLELYHSFPGRTFSLNPWDGSDSADIRTIVTFRFLEYQYDFNKRVIQDDAKEPSLSRVMDAWATFVKPGDVILTFNWDVLHETILWRSRLWSYRDGYGFSCDGQGEKEQLTKTLMLKLHGSVNWVQKDENNLVAYIADVKNFFPESQDWKWRPHYDESQADSGRKLVLPTYLKDISSNKALLPVWTSAYRAVNEAKEMIVVGYSLNPVDHPARLLFGTALSANAGLDRVTVVSPSTGEWDEFLNLMNKKVIPVRMRFEDWVVTTGQ